MQLIKTMMPVLLAASAAAAPHRQEARDDHEYLRIAEKEGITSRGAVEKRQYKEALEWAGPRVDEVIKRVFDWLEGASESGSLLTRQIQGKATDYSCIGGEKKVAPNWLENGLKPKIAAMVEAPEGTLVSSSYPQAMMSQRWAARQNGQDGGHDGDWVNVDVAWSQIPNYNGQHAEMSTTLFEEILQYGMDICASGSPARVQGFYAGYNREWGIVVDITNIDDSDTEAAYGNTYDWQTN